MNQNNNQKKDPYLEIENKIVGQFRRYLENENQVNLNGNNQPKVLEQFAYPQKNIQPAQRFLTALGLTNVLPMISAFQETYMQFSAQFNEIRLIIRISQVTHKINQAEIINIRTSIQRRPTLTIPCKICKIASFQELFIVDKIYNKDLNFNDTSDFNQFLQRIEASNCIISVTEQYICSLDQFVGFLRQSNETIADVMILRILKYISKLLIQLSSQFSILVENIDPQGIVFCCERRKDGLLSIRFDPQFITFSQLYHTAENHQERNQLNNIEEFHFEIIQKLYEFLGPLGSNFQVQGNREQEVEYSSAERIKQFLERVLPIQMNRQQRMINIFQTNGELIKFEEYRDNSILYILKSYSMFPNDQIIDGEDQNNDNDYDDDDDDDDEEEEEKKDEEEDQESQKNKIQEGDYMSLPDSIPAQNNSPQTQIIDIKSLLLKLWEISKPEINQYFRNNLLKQHYMQSNQFKTIQEFLQPYRYTIQEFSNSSMNSKGLLAQKTIELMENQNTIEEVYIKAYYLPAAHNQTQQRLQNSALNLQQVGYQIDRADENNLKYFSESTFKNRVRYSKLKEKYRLRRENNIQMQLQEEQVNNIQDAQETLRVYRLIQKNLPRQPTENQVWQFVIFEKCCCSLRDLVPAIALLSNEVKPIVLYAIYNGLTEFILKLKQQQLTHSELTLDRILIDMKGNLRINNCQSMRNIKSPPIITLEPLAGKILQQLSELDSEYVKKEFQKGSYIELVEKVDRISVAMMMAELTFGLDTHKLIAAYLKNPNMIVRSIEESVGLMFSDIHEDREENLNLLGNKNLNKLRLKYIDLFQRTKEEISKLNVNIPNQEKYQLEIVQMMVLELFS